MEPTQRPAVDFLYLTSWPTHSVIKLPSKSPKKQSQDTAATFQILCRANVTRSSVSCPNGFRSKDVEPLKKVKLPLVWTTTGATAVTRPPADDFRTRVSSSFLFWCKCQITCSLLYRDVKLDDMTSNDDTSNWGRFQAWQHNVQLTRKVTQPIYKWRRNVGLLMEENQL